MGFVSCLSCFFRYSTRMHKTVSRGFRPMTVYEVFKIVFNVNKCVVGAVKRLQLLLSELPLRCCRLCSKPK